MAYIWNLSGFIGSLISIYRHCSIEFLIVIPVDVFLRSQISPVFLFTWKKNDIAMVYQHNFTSARHYVVNGKVTHQAIFNENWNESWLFNKYDVVKSQKIPAQF